MPVDYPVVFFQETETFSDKIISRFKDFLDDDVLRSVAAEGRKYILAFYLQFLPFCLEYNIRVQFTQ